MTSAARNALIVDDDPDICRLLSHLLGKQGLVVRCAEDGDEALRQIEALCPHFLITDWEMPGISGVELCRRLRSMSLPHYTYVMMLSSRSQLADVVLALEAGADDFVTKPLQTVELYARLKAGNRVLDLESRLSFAAKRDPLTGLLNRRTFFEQFDREWARADRYGSPLSCVMCDIDYFKKINDTYGHIAGDEVLRVVGRVLEQHCRSSDYACRYGGEEFCILLPETNEAGAAIWADRVRCALRGKTVEISGGGKLQIQASLGVAEMLDDTEHPEELVDLADHCLLAAKGAGRDRVVRLRDLRGRDQGGSIDTLRQQTFRNVLARDVMTALVLSLNESDPIEHAVDFLLGMRVSSAPVVDNDGKLRGIVSEKDLVGAMLTERGLGRTVGEVMRTNVVCYEENTPAEQIYDFLCRVTIRRVVVVCDGRPTGTLSRGCFLRWYRNLLSARPRGGRGELSVADPRPALRKTASALADRALELKSQLGAGADFDYVPQVVAEATHMQELINDLLAHCQMETALGEAPAEEIGRCAYESMGALAAAALLQDGPGSADSPA